MVAAIGNGAAFAKGRDFGAWLGLVPRQISAGGRTILGKISKRTIATVRVLFVQAARARSDARVFLPSDLVGLLHRGANVLFRMRGEMG